jgi:lipoate-protein ligase A
VTAGRTPRGTEKPEGAEQSACFTAPASFEQVYRGCKLTGSAQKRQHGAFLQHGSIPVDLDPEQLFAALDTRGKLDPVEGGRLLARQVGWLNRWLPEPVTVAEVETRLVACFAATLAINLEADAPRAAELQRCDELVTEKYGNPAWNLAGIVSVDSTRMEDRRSR